MEAIATQIILPEWHRCSFIFFIQDSVLQWNSQPPSKSDVLDFCNIFVR